MHIFLGILKILGIVLLLILLLILLIIGIVLFAPVRYEADASNNGSLRLSAQIRWLFKLIHADVRFEDKKFRLKISLFGKTLKEIPEQERAPAVSEDEIFEQPEEEQPAPQAEQQPEEERPAPQAKPEPEEPQPAPQAEPEPEAQTGPEGKTPQKKEKKPEKAKKTKKIKKTKKTSALTGVTGKLASLPEKIADLITKVYDTGDKIDDKLSHGLRKMESLQHKIGMVTDEGSMKFYRGTVRRLVRMLRHFRFRSITGNVRLGTGSPDLTGMLTGVIYIMLPAGADRFCLDPDFYEAVFEGNVHLKGHIRICHVAYVALTVLVNPEFYRLLKKIRKIRRGA